MIFAYIYKQSYCYVHKNAEESIDHLLIKNLKFLFQFVDRGLWHFLFSLIVIMLVFPFFSERIVNGLTWEFCG